MEEMAGGRRTEAHPEDDDGQGDRGPRSDSQRGFHGWLPRMELGWADARPLLLFHTLGAAHHIRIDLSQAASGRLGNGVQHGQKSFPVRNLQVPAVDDERARVRQLAEDPGQRLGLHGEP